MARQVALHFMNLPCLEFPVLRAYEELLKTVFSTWESRPPWRSFTIFLRVARTFEKYSRNYFYVGLGSSKNNLLFKS